MVYVNCIIEFFELYYTPPGLFQGQTRGPRWVAICWFGCCRQNPICAVSVEVCTIIMISLLAGEQAAEQCNCAMLYEEGTSHLRQGLL